MIKSNFQQFEARLQEAMLSFLPKETESLSIAANHQMELGGKRLRPWLLSLVAGESRFLDKKVINACAAVELFHNFTLAHDDIMDNSLVRRGKPTVFADHGSAKAILAGDALYVASLLALEAADLPSEARLLFHRTAMEVCIGQQMDMDFEERERVSYPEYERMITLKTAVLLACSATLGAYLSGASSDESAKIYEIAKEVGIVFQLQDDYLDTFGEVAKTGKVIGGDLLAGKHALPKVLALEEELVSIENFRSVQRGESVALGLIQTLKTQGVEEMCQKVITQKQSDIQSSISGMPERIKQALLSFIALLDNRSA